MNEIQKLRIVEIELFSYCNRKCGWCPNSYIDRQSNIHYIKTSVFLQLLSSLRANNYTGVISFSRYNEPFSNFKALQYAIGLIKLHLPDVKLVSNTNGDYLTEEILKEMLIDELSIMDYDNRGRDYVLNKLVNWNVTDIHEYSHYFVGNYNNKKILYYYSWNEVANISDRGGNIPNYSTQERDYPCFEPLHFIGVNYDGTVSPCCNVRSDCENQKDYIIGDLNSQSLEEIMKSDKYLNFVDKTTTANFSCEMPCYYCNNTGGRYTKNNGGILYE